MHAPTLPSLPSWETPIAASREIVEAIADVAGSAVEAATSVVARRRRRATPVVVWVGLGAALLAAVALVRALRHRGGSSDAAARAQPTDTAADLVDVSDPRSDGASRGERTVGSGV